MSFLNHKAVLAKIPSDTHILAVWAGADEGFKDPTLVLKPLCPSATHVTVSDVTHGYFV